MDTIKWSGKCSRLPTPSYATPLTAALGLCLLSVGCSGSDDDSNPGATPGLSVSPVSAEVLTCSTQTFTAEVSDQADDSVIWSVGADTGSMNSQGVYSAPMSMPASPNVTVTAKSATNDKLLGKATITLGTAFPSVPKRIAGSSTGGAKPDNLGGVYEHGTVAQGQRVYTVWRTGDGEHVTDIMTARSNDGGATWQSGVRALRITTPNDISSEPGTHCVSLAIDAGNPDVVYVVTTAASWGNSIADSVLPGREAGGSVALLVSEDGGATFAMHVIKVTNGGPGICPDVVSPAADSVVISVPNPDNAEKRDIGIWSDAQRGAGFVTGTADSDDLAYEADGETHALALLAADHALAVNAGSSSGTSGGEWESPRLFTNGKGRLCITYTAVYQDDAHHDDLNNVYVQCSDDAGKTFSELLELDTQTGSDQHTPYTAVGAMDASGHVAVAWSADDNQSRITLALSSDAGATFGKPFKPKTLENADLSLDGQANVPSLGFDAAGILWLAYQPYDGGSTARLAVDKSCDHGTTWSGPVALGGGTLANPSVQLTKGTIVLTADAAPHIMAYEHNSDDGDPLTYLSLTPTK